MTSRPSAAEFPNKLPTRKTCLFSHPVYRKQRTRVQISSRAHRQQITGVVRSNAKEHDAARRLLSTDNPGEGKKGPRVGEGTLEDGERSRLINARSYA